MTLSLVVLLAIFSDFTLAINEPGPSPVYCERIYTKKVLNPSMTYSENTKVMEVCTTSAVPGYSLPFQCTFLEVAIEGQPTCSVNPISMDSVYECRKRRLCQSRECDTGCYKEFAEPNATITTTTSTIPATATATSVSTDGHYGEATTATSAEYPHKTHAYGDDGSDNDDGSDDQKHSYGDTYGGSYGNNKQHIYHPDNQQGSYEPPPSKSYGQAQPLYPNKGYEPGTSKGPKPVDVYQGGVVPEPCPETPPTYTKPDYSHAQPDTYNVYTTPTATPIPYVGQAPPNEVDSTVGTTTSFNPDTYSDTTTDKNANVLYNAGHTQGPLFVFMVVLSWLSMLF